MGNSQGIVLPKKFLQQYQLSGAADLRPISNDLVIAPIIQPARQGWEKQFQAAMPAGQEPEGDLV